MRRLLLAFLTLFLLPLGAALNAPDLPPTGCRNIFSDLMCDEVPIWPTQVPPDCRQVLADGRCDDLAAGTVPGCHQVGDEAFGLDFVCDEVANNVCGFVWTRFVQEACWELRDEHVTPCIRLSQETCEQMLAIHGTVFAMLRALPVFRL